MFLDLPGKILRAEHEGGESTSGAGPSAPAFLPRRKTHVELARELGISDRTVRTKRQRGMSDEEIAMEAQVLSRKHDPRKRERAPGSAMPGQQLQQVAEAVAGKPANAEAGGSPPPAGFTLVAPPLPSGMSPMGEASLRKEQAEARLRELKLAEEEGRLVDVTAVRQELSAVVREVRDSMLTIAARLAPRVAAITDERQVYGLIYQEIEQGLHVAAAKVMEYEHAA